MKKLSTVAISLSVLLVGSGVAAAAPEYPPVPGTGPQSRAIVGYTLSSAEFAERFLPRLSALELTGSSIITITGYASKSKSAAADRALGLRRANETAKQMRTLAPKAKIRVVSRGSTYTASCKVFGNKCTIVTISN